MPEDNQIQTGFQPEIQANSLIQQNNLVQNGQPIQQNNVGSTNQRLEQNIAKHTQNIYYHPTRLTKILSGIYRFLGIALVRAGLRNFSLIGTEDLPFLKILYVGGVITLCGILYIFLGRLLYKTKKWVPYVSLLMALVANKMFSRILTNFTNHYYGYGINSDTSEQFGFNIVLFSVIYFLILTIVWLVKCYRFKKKGIINLKYLDATPSKKKVGIITTIILLLIVAVGLIYSKIKWPKIPEIDESIFQRTEHQTKLSDKEDAIVQLKILDNNYGNKRTMIDILNYYYLYVLQSDYSFLNNNKDISWRQHTNECIVINSGGNEYCGTWAWNKKTLNRTLNNYFYMGNNSYYNDFFDSDGYLSIDGKKVTIFEYIHKNESEMKEIFEELDYISSLNYYLSDNEETILPASPQGYSRASMIVLLYYIYQKDRDMVTFIIKLNYKIVNIFNDSGNIRNLLISMAIQNIVDSSINSYIQLFPKNLREELSERYETQISDKDEIIDKMMKGEFVTRNRAKNENIMGEVGKDTPSLLQFLFHFPFYSEKEINRLMVYSYYELWYGLKNNIKEATLGDKMKNVSSLYNVFRKYPYYTLIPRASTFNDRINRSTFHKQALIKNLQSGKYDVWFSKPDRETDTSNYDQHRLSVGKNLSN